MPEQVFDAAALSAAATDARGRASVDADPISAADWTAKAESLAGFADEVTRLDAQENEIQHQLRWWNDRVAELESSPSGDAAELALFKGRIAGATAMLRHYGLERSALHDRIADASAS